jgi:hypothetical protein
MPCLDKLHRMKNTLRVAVLPLSAAPVGRGADGVDAMA